MMTAWVDLWQLSMVHRPGAASALGRAHLNRGGDRTAASFPVPYRSLAELRKHSIC